MNRSTESGVKTLETERPFTPFNAQRSLYGPRFSTRSPNINSLRQVRFFDIEPLPNLPLTPPHNLTLWPSNNAKTKRWKLPSIKKTNHHKHLFTSLDNLLEELENKEVSSVKTSGIRNPENETHKRLTSSKSLDGGGGNWVPAMSYTPMDNSDQKNVLRIANDEESSLNNEECSIEERRSMSKIQDLTDLASFDNCINEARALNTTKVSSVTEDDPPPLENILSELKALDHEKIDEEKTLNMFASLYSRLKEEGLTSRYCPHSKLKSKVLKNIYTFVENGTDPVLLEIAHMSLALKVKGPNISSVCKLIFKVTRSAKNDELFLRSDILDLFIESLTTPLEDPEALIYAYGALKFLTMNRTLLQSLLDRGLMQLMMLHLKLVNTAHQDGIQIHEQTSHAIFQLTGTMRHVANSAASLFVSTGALQELCITLKLFSADIDLVANIARTLSILSARKDCSYILLEWGMLPAFIELFSKYPGRQDIVIRLAYSLGNILECSVAARCQLFEEPNALKVLISLLESYMKKDLREMQSSILKEDKQNTDSSQDVIIKLVRVIANMATEPDVGARLVCEVNDFDEATYYDRKDECLKFLHILLTILSRKSSSENEEIVVAALITLNNLIFYSVEGPVSKTYLDIAQGLSPLIRLSHARCLIEVTRVFGNLTRSQQIRQFFVEIGGLSELRRWLHCANRELLFTSTGLLVNLMANTDTRVVFRNSETLERLVSILEKHCEKDWNLAILICQALWNFASDSPDIHSAFGPDNTPRILTALVFLLDEERFFSDDIRGGETKSEEYQEWEDFAEIATNLLEKLEY